MFLSYIMRSALNHLHIWKLFILKKHTQTTKRVVIIAFPIMWQIPDTALVGTL